MIYTSQDIKWTVKDVVTRFFGSLNILTNTFLKGGTFVTDKSDLVLEGYPRSGNTFCVAALFCSTNESISIARHRHEIGQLQQALKLKIPVNVIIRDPENSISSFVLRENVSPSYALQYYISYYRFLLNHASDLFIFDFLTYLNNVETYTRFIIRKSNYQGDILAFDDISKRIKEKIILMEQVDSGTIEIRPNHVSLPSDYKELEKQKIIKFLRDKHKNKMNIAADLYIAVNNATVKL